MPLPWVLVLVVAAGGGAAAYEYRARLFAFVSGEPAASPAADATPSAGVVRSDSPEPERERERRRRRLVIHGTGDVNLDHSYIPALAANGYAYAWSGLEGLFREDDLTVVNLECAASELGKPIEKEFNFRCDPGALPAMRRAGVEVANLGNNHSGDFGPEALVDARRNVRRARIAAVGAGRDIDQATKPALFRIKGWRIAVLGFGGVVPARSWYATETRPGMANGNSIPEMVRAVRAADEVADLVVVSIHWGTELTLEPDPDDVRRGHAMVRAGADVIFGHHAHRLQPMEVYRGRPIFWGLGNFVWPNFSYEGSVTGVARVAVSPDGTLRARILPAFIEAPGHPVLVGRRAGSPPGP